MGRHFFSGWLQRRVCRGRHRAPGEFATGSLQIVDPTLLARDLGTQHMQRFILIGEPHLQVGEAVKQCGIRHRRTWQVGAKASVYRFVHPPEPVMPTPPSSLEPAADEIEITAILAQGKGGQNVNKTASAAHLRYDIRAASLPETVKLRLLALRDRRIGADGVIVIKAQQYRSLERNREAAVERLRKLIAKAAERPKPRKPTQPTLGSRRRRLDEKTRRGSIKRLRGAVDAD